MLKDSVFLERIRLASSRGGLLTTLLWLVKEVLCVEIYVYLEYDLIQSDNPAEAATGNSSLFKLDSVESMEKSTPNLVSALGKLSGRQIKDLVMENSVVYALVDSDRVKSQLNICRNEQQFVDTPINMVIEYGAGNYFLSFLHTWPEYRRMGLGSHLIRGVCEDLRTRSQGRVYTHVSRTNLPSLNTFSRLGWRRVGWTITSRRGRLVYAHALSRHGIRITTP